MARNEITMPQLGETVTEGTITRWIKQVGDEVKEDDLLFEVSTDKVDSEVPSPASGYLAEILVQEGDTVEVGTPIAALVDSPDEVEGGGGGGAPAAEDEAAAEAEAEEAPAEKEPAAEEAEAPSAPEPRPEPEPRAAPASEEAPPRREPVEAGGDGHGQAGEAVVLSPVVRRLMAEYDVSPSEVEGTGEGGRITRNDVLAFIERQREGGGTGAEQPAPSRQGAPTQAPERSRPEPERRAPSAPQPARAEAPTPVRAEGDEIIPMSNIRKRTAEHMVRSKATSPHVMMSIEVDFEGVERVRAAHRESWREEEGFSLTYLPFIARAVCDAIADYPHVNSSVDGDDLVVHQTVNLAIAVDLDFEGLLAPVVRSAEGLRLRHLARAIRDLADRARSRGLAPDDVVGGTYTITNPGPFDSFLSAPIINQPQVAILSTEGIKKRPVVVEGPAGDSIAIRHVGYLSQSFDHRAFDGAYCAAYLQRLKEIIETRDWESEVT